MSGLENEWQVRLFERTTRKVELTPAGQMCYLTVTRMLSQYDHMLSETEKIKRTFSGELKLGCNAFSSIPEPFVQSLRILKQEYPGLKTTIQVAGSNDLVPMVEKMKMMKVALTHKYAVLSSDHPLAERAALSLWDLAGIPIIFMKDRETRTHQIVLQVCQEISFSLMEAAPAADYDEMIMRVSIGGEAAITSFAYSDHYYRDVVFRPITDLEEPEINGWRVLMWRKDNTNEGVQTLRRILERQLEAAPVGAPE